MSYPPGTRIVYADFRLSLPARFEATPLGLATSGCVAHPLGVRPMLDARFEDTDPFENAASIFEHLNGSERWDIDREASGDIIDEWILVKVAGPYTVDNEGVKLRLSCACGWVGKVRDNRARRLLGADAAGHVCQPDL